MSKPSGRHQKKRSRADFANKRTRDRTIYLGLTIIGLAVMGENLVLNMARHGFTVAVYNRTTARVDDFIAGRAAGRTIIGTYSLEELCAALQRPRRIIERTADGIGIYLAIGTAGVGAVDELSTFAWRLQQQRHGAFAVHIVMWNDPITLVEHDHVQRVKLGLVDIQTRLVLQQGEKLHQHRRLVELADITVGAKLIRCQVPRTRGPETTLGMRLW